MPPVYYFLVVLVVAALYLVGWQFDKRYYVRKIRPTKLQIMDLTDGKLITYRWVHTRHYVWVFLLLVYISFMTWMLVWLAQAPERGPFAVFAVVFVVLFGYWPLAGFYNKTVIVVSKTGNLRVYHRPFPAFGDRARNIGSIRNITYRKERFFAGIDFIFSVFPIYVHTKDGKRIRIIHEVDTEQAAIDIQTALRDVLNIADDQPKLLQIHDKLFL